MRAALTLTLVLALCLGCRSAAFTIAEHKDTEDVWRSFLADHEIGAEAEAARERLDDKVWTDAETIGTRLAYRRYLDEFPSGAHAEDALDRLRRLRHARMGEADDLDAATSPEVGTPVADVRGDDAAFAAAAHGDGIQLRRFLALHPRSPHRDAAGALLATREIHALGWEERFAEAEAQLNGLPSRVANGALVAELCERKARVARAGAAALADLGSDGLALVLADAPAVDALARGLSAEEAADVIGTIWALADTGSPAALDPLLHAMDPERSLAVRWAARRAIAQLAAGWPAEVRELELESRRQRIAVRAASAPLWIEEALLEAELGLEESQVTLAKARHDAPDNPLPLALTLERPDVRDPERGLVAQQLEGLLVAVPAAEGCARQWLGRLARGQPAAVEGTCTEGPPPAAKAAEARRLAALTGLLGRNGPRAPALTAQLGRLAERDGAAPVRAAARAALAGADTLSISLCAAPPSLVVSPAP